MHARASRVIVLVEDIGSSHTRKEICFDISPLIGKTIEDDLRQRDFTINAIAASLDEVVRYLGSRVTEQSRTALPSHPEGDRLSREGDRKGRGRGQAPPLLYNEGTDS